jgi:hypothetical protein
MRRLVILPLLLLPAYGQAGTDVFAQKIRPLLERRCGACHGSGAKVKFAGLVLDSAEGIRKGSDAGAVVIPGDAAASRLMKALRGELPAPMPPTGALAADEIEAVAEWIRGGAHMGGATAPRTPSFDLEARRAAHWAWQPLRTVGGGASIDGFLSARLKAAGLTPAPRASKAALARRLAFDLTGMPLAEADRRQFLDNPAPEAYEQLVDRLLASPRFGERWARHWMDLVRYSESHGSEGDPDVPQAWQYRDYLIRAFNGDVGYDQLIREHLAGDLLASPRLDAAAKTNESILGTAHLRMVEHGFQPVDPWEDRVRWVDNQVDVFAKAFQGLTVSCARCHDHKFDAISQRDYYALFGIFSNCRPTQRAIDRPEELARNAAAMRTVKAEIRGKLAGAWLQAADRLEWKPGPAWSPQALVAELETGGAAAAERWKREAESRRSFNKGFLTVWDVRGEAFGKWLGHGAGLPQAAAKPGDFAVQLAGPQIVSTLLPGGVYSNGLTDKHGAVFTSPRFKIDSDYISVRINGGNYSFAQIIVENYAVGRGGIYQLRQSPSQPEMRWATIKTAFWKGFTAYVELVTKDEMTHLTQADADHMNRPRAKPVNNGRSWFGVQAVVFHNGKEPPRDELLPGALLLAGDEPPSKAKAAAITREAVRAWAANRASEEQAAWLNALLTGGMLPASLPALQSEYRALEAEVPVARRAPGVFEEAGAAQALLIRGGHKNPGEVVPRRYLTALGSREYEDARTARLRLAAEVASTDNPLTGRVIVNRLWAKLFGKGIVSTVDNFGMLGDRPSHPELLDWLAREFMSNGWSMKRMIRRMVLSEAYQRSSEASADAQRKDPANRLLQHMPVKRMEAEALRDTMLAISGQLNEERYGRSVPVYYLHETGKTKGDRPKGPADGNGRRSIYLEVRRNATNPLLEVFDFPVPSSTRGERDWTNVPAQSLALLNSPFVIGQADRWAERMLQTHRPAGERLAAMFETATGRAATAVELERMQALVREFAAAHKAGEVAADRNVWRDVAHSLFNLKEFLYIP